MALDNKDGGWRSRKLGVTILAMGLITIVACAAGKFSAIEGVYGTFVGGVVAVVGLFLTGNVANSFVVGKTKPPKAEPPKDE